MKLEVCCGNPESVHEAVLGGAQRIELCSHLELDGLTPPWDWLQSARAAYPSLKIHVLVRPRAGDFVYSASEIAGMSADIEKALDLGADGIVIGALTASGDVDMDAMQQLCDTVTAWSMARDLRGDLCHASNDSHFFRPLQEEPAITFHRAFDKCREPFSALEDIVRLGCSRILTSGQAASAAEGCKLIRALREKARGRLVLLPGGGINPSNARSILDASGCTELHASASTVRADGKKISDRKLVAAILEAMRQ